MDSVGQSVNSIGNAASSVSEAGIAAILLFIIMIILVPLGLLSWYVLRRLFNEATGLFPKFLTKHSEFLEKLSDNYEAQTAAQKEQLEVSRKIDSALVRLAGKEDTDGTLDLLRLWRHKIAIIRKIADKLGIASEVEVYLSDMEAIVRKR